MKTRTAEDSVKARWGDALRSARIAAGLSQTELGVRASIDQSTVSKIERADYAALTPALLIRLAVAVGRHPHNLYEWPENLLAAAGFEGEAVA